MIKIPKDVEARIRLAERCEQLEDTLRRLKRGDCWCDMASNPMVSSHDMGCMKAQLLMRER